MYSNSNDLRSCLMPFFIEHTHAPKIIVFTRFMQTAVITIFLQLATLLCDLSR